MKQCPACKNTYTDESLRFCLADGETLITIADKEEETVVRHGVPLTSDQPPAPITTMPKERSGSSGGLIIKLVIAAIVLLFLGLIALSAIGFIFYSSTGGGNTNTIPYPTPKATASPSATPDSDKERLEKELADLQKKLEEQANKPSPTKTPPGFESDGSPKARVNSPKDGFLALRSLPDSEKGERLARIPHGTVVALENCEKEKTTLAGKSGRWCMVTYSGSTGWVFDGWLQY
jgi:hypothetical protein